MLTLDQVVLGQGDFQMTAHCEVPSGITAVLGPSGGGKSTLLGALAGFVPLRSGALRYQNADMGAVPPGQRPVSILFQDNNLFPHLTLGQNVGLALRPRLRLSAQDAARVETVLSDVGLAGLGARKPGGVSGGQQSRAALARLLLADRPIVLMDEPFAALGPGMKADMLALVREKLAQAGRIIVMVTHDPADAKAVADQVCLLADGVLSPPVKTQALFDNPPRALRDYLGLEESD